MTLDPTDDCTFWFTQEYYTAAGQAFSVVGWQTRVGSFKYATCTAAPKGTLTGIITDCTSGLPIAGALVSVEGGSFRTTDATGSYAMPLPPGTYNVTVSSPGHDPFASMATISNGSPTTLNACLPITSTLVTPVALFVEDDGNRVLEPNEFALLRPSWRNDGSSDVHLTGSASNFAGPGSGYTIPDTTGDYGTIAVGATAQCIDCYVVLINPGTRPVQHWDATIDETVSPSSTLKTWTLHVGNSFSDVSSDIAADPYYPSIETVFHNGVTAGCGTAPCSAPPIPPRARRWRSSS